jgi:hypothetical protein
MFLSFQFHSKLFSVNEIGYVVGGVGGDENVTELGGWSVKPMGRKELRGRLADADHLIDGLPKLVLLQLHRLRAWYTEDNFV